MSEANVGKFELLATYGYSVQKLRGASEDAARQYGYRLAVYGCQFGPSVTNVYAEVEQKVMAKPSSSIGSADFDKVIARIGEAYFFAVFEPAITALVRNEVPYDNIKRALQLSQERGAKVSQQEFEERVFVLNL